jgi:hypothetical protein
MQVVRATFCKVLKLIEPVQRQSAASQRDDAFAAEILQNPVHMDRRQTQRVGDLDLS